MEATLEPRHACSSYPSLQLLFIRETEERTDKQAELSSRSEKHLKFVFQGELATIFIFMAARRFSHSESDLGILLTFLSELCLCVCNHPAYALYIVLIS